MLIITLLVSFTVKKPTYIGRFLKKNYFFDFSIDAKIESVAILVK